jgi:signal transduction histidine kinase
MASGLNQSLYLQARQAEELRRINKELDRRVEQRTAELALANQRLTELDRLKSEFVAMAAHELRTPLTILMGFSELLVQRPALGEQERQRYTSFIHQHAVRLAAIVSNLLDLSRIESGHRDDLNRKPFNLLPLVEDMAASFRAQSANHTYRIKGSQAWPIVEGDQGELGQVVYNLLSNATKYSPGGGEVVIDGQPAGDYLQVSVQDCGIGISPEAQAHLFEPFYRADASNTSISGPGLGLVICKGIIDRHGGAIWVNSQPGVGTTVYFTVPLAAE